MDTELRRKWLFRLSITLAKVQVLTEAPRKAATLVLTLALLLLQVFVALLMVRLELVFRKAA